MRANSSPRASSSRPVFRRVILLMVVVAIFVIFIWPIMGMEVLIPVP